MSMMIDKVTLYRPYPVNFPKFGENEIKLYKNIEFYPERSEYKKQITRYTGNFQNLQIQFYENSVKVSNSLSHFLYGHNAEDLTHSDLISAIEIICDFLDCELSDLNIRSLEFGLNLSVSVPPYQIIQRLLAHKGSQIVESIKKTKLVGRKFYHHNYNFKAYDKALEQRLTREKLIEGYILRLEEQFKIKHIPMGIYTTADLVLPENLGLLYNQFMKQWRNIEKAPFIDTSNMDVKTKDWFYARMNPLYWFDQKKINSNRAKIGKQRFKKKISEIGDYSLFEEVESLIEKKYVQLMANDNVPDFPRIIIAGNRVHRSRIKTTEN